MEKYVNENNEVVTKDAGTWVVSCDLCGKEIHIYRSGSNVETYVPRYRASAGFTNRNGSDRRGEISVDAIIPKIKIHSIVKEYEVDICEDCESKILNAIRKNSPEMIKGLLTTDGNTVLNYKAEFDSIKERCRNLDNETSNLRDSLDILRNRYD